MKRAQQTSTGVTLNAGNGNGNGNGNDVPDTAWVPAATGPTGLWPAAGTQNIAP